MDSVFVEGLALRGKHGVHHRERQEEQDFILDIKATIDTITAAKSDNIADTVDYRRFCEIACECVEERSFDLIEKLAHEIASGILADTRVTRVEITVRKPQALKNGVAGVIVVRTQV